jgi:hypothetical protein
MSPDSYCLRGWGFIYENDGCFHLLAIKLHQSELSELNELYTRFCGQHNLIPYILETQIAENRSTMWHFYDKSLPHAYVKDVYDVHRVGWTTQVVYGINNKRQVIIMATVRESDHSLHNTYFIYKFIGSDFHAISTKDYLSDLSCDETWCEMSIVCEENKTSWLSVVPKSSSSYECADDGSFVSSAWVCDNVQDCAAGEDEVGCKHTLVENNPDNKRRNILHNYVSDMWIDGCRGQYNISFLACHNPLYFTCPDRDCVPLNTLCNGYKDCKGGAD